MGAVSMSVSSATEQIMMVWVTAAGAHSASAWMWITATVLVRNRFRAVFLAGSVAVCAAFGLGQLPVILLHGE